ncbi:MAG: hypothetical protein JXK05_01935 [Campylobacterales bacterium]|nr:hypothetical protein [Campylobacterales bacterium]
MENDINVDLADYQIILSHEGKIEGRVGSCKVADFMTNLDEVFKNSLSSAKGALIEFDKSKDAGFNQLFSQLRELNEYFDENADMIFGLKQNDALELDSINYKIIATGI